MPVEDTENGEEAVQLAMTDEFSANLMDCEMPVMNGWDATVQIRAKKPEVPPIMAVTAYVSDEDRQRCPEAGMCDFLAKPISPAKIKRARGRWMHEAEAEPVFVS